MKSMISAAALAVATLFAAPASAVPTFSFSASASHINVGDAVTIEATMSGLGPEVLSGFDLNFLYDSAVLNWTLIEYFGANLGASLGLNTNGLPEGDLGVDDISLDDDATLDANQADSFLLFRFTLLGVADGATTFTLGPDPDFQRALVGMNFSLLDVDIGSICVSVGRGDCQVPEPAGYGLAGIALLGALATSRRRRRDERADA